jgi:hypothetical protein
MVPVSGIAIRMVFSACFLNARTPPNETPGSLAVDGIALLKVLLIGVKFYTAGKPGANAAAIRVRVRRLAQG